jgi:RHS repeat-associated protein
MSLSARVGILDRRSLAPVFCVLLAFASASPLFAQTNVNEEQGLKPYDSLHGGDLDSVSLTNGGLVLHVPLASFPQRGNLDLSFFLRYSTKQWYVKVKPSCYDPNCKPTYTYKWTPVRANTGAQIVSSMDWRLQTTATLDPSFNQSLISPDGNSHLMGGSDSSGTPVYPAYSLDATGLQLTGAVGSTPTLTLPNGTRYSFVAGAGTNLTSGIQPTSVTDANGNQITLSTSGWTDTLGRLIPGSGNGSPSTVPIQPGVPTTDLSNCPSGTVSASIWNVPGPAGGTRTFKFCNSNLTLQTFFNPNPGTIPTDYGPGATPLLTAIVLPDLTMWTLGFDSYGDVVRLGLPTGGSISYTYTNRPIACGSDWTNVSRWVTSRTVDANDGTGGHTWTYTYTNTGVTVTDPAGNDAAHTIASPIAGTACSLYETQTQFYQGSASGGTLLKTTATQYQGAASNFSVNGDYSVAVNVAPVQRTITLPGGQTSKVISAYDSGSFAEQDGTPVVIGSVLQTDEYDFSGALVRSTLSHYLWQDNGTYKSNNFLSLPVSTTVKDGAGNQKAQTTYAYDQSTPLSSSITTHLVSPPAGGNIRGNPTTAGQWLNTSNSMLSGTATYFDTGMKATGTDPLGHTTTYSYSSSFVGAYVTQTCSPQTGTVTHCVSGNYDFNTGHLTSFTDQNSQTSSYQYDNMLRLTQGNHPDGGQTTLTYQVSAFPFSATLTKKINATQNLVTKAVIDGLGRVTQSQLTSDPQGTVYTDMTYDAVGRKSTASNPHRSAASPTDGITTIQYDALSRTTKVIPPDGSTSSNNISTVYSDNCTTVTDQAGKTRKSCSDALGRLVQIFEDHSGSNLETDYQYDTLNNLTRVDQKGSAPSDSTQWRTRTFTYNSLSQLLTAANPESGTITYAYNNDGLLASKTDARGITVNYDPSESHIDALHRVTKVTYSNGDPSLFFGYDGIAPSGCTPPALTINNGIGHRTAMCDAAGSEAWSFDITSGVGWKTTDVRTTSGVTKTSIYQNNLAGSLSALTYPSGRVVTYAYNAAAQPLSAMDNSNVTYASGAVYSPTGALASLTEGTGLVSTFYYNTRLQPCRISVKSSGSAPGSCADSANIGNILDFNYNFSLGAADNGNVTSITNNRDTARSQSFTYDSLNRIATADTQATTGTKCWGESFSYDAWANLLSIGGLSGYTGCTQESLTTAATTKNQISGYGYDASGNMTSIPSIATYTYNAESELTSAAGVTYTYDGDGKRVQKSNGKLYWYGIGSVPLDETDLTGSTTNSAFHEYIFFGGKRIARLDSSGNANYYFADHLGSSRVVTNSTGTVLDDSDFYPFGKERPYLSSSGNNYKFTGKERDSESGLDDFGARYYASNLGRFVSADWSAIPVPVPYAELTDPQSLNLYTYVRNNPMVNVDPLGHEAAGMDGVTVTNNPDGTKTGTETTTKTDTKTISLGNGNWQTVTTTTTNTTSVTTTTGQNSSFVSGTFSFSGTVTVETSGIGFAPRSETSPISGSWNLAANNRDVQRIEKAMAGPSDRVGRLALALPQAGDMARTGVNAELKFVAAEVAIALTVVGGVAAAPTLVAGGEAALSRINPGEAVNFARGVVNPSNPTTPASGWEMAGRVVGAFLKALFQ